MDYRLFLQYIKFADSYKNVQQNIYFFLKDLGFQRLIKENGNRFPTPESQNMFNSFQMEMQRALWKRQNISIDEYKRFLEEFFKKMDFNNSDLETLKLTKLITENLGIFGNFDNLTSKRIQYLNKKIEGFKNTQSKPPTKSNNKIQTNNVNVPQNTNVNAQNNLGLPDAGKEDPKSKDAKKEAQKAEDARLNEIMRQMKLNSPVYITNVQPGCFYNPYTNTQYIPKKVNRNFPLPMNKKDPNYPKLKAIIEEELILANQELDYHKIDMAREHLEAAAYYLKNVID